MIITIASCAYENEKTMQLMCTRLIFLLLLPRVEWERCGRCKFRMKMKTHHSVHEVMTTFADEQLLSGMLLACSHVLFVMEIAKCDGFLKKAKTSLDDATARQVKLWQKR